MKAQPLVLYALRTCSAELRASEAVCLLPVSPLKAETLCTHRWCMLRRTQTAAEACTRSDGAGEQQHARACLCQEAGLAGAECQDGRRALRKLMGMHALSLPAT